MAKQQVAYDPSVIQEFANTLYQQAQLIIITSCFLGLFIGSMTGGLVMMVTIKYASFRSQYSFAPHSLYSQSLPPSFDSVWILVVIFALLGVSIGYGRGIKQALKLRLEAQVALCQVQIEKNTGRPDS